MKIKTLLTVVVIGVATDFAAKAWARDALNPYGPAIEFLPFISLRLAFNHGISFGLLAHDSPGAAILLVAMAGVITVVMTIWAIRTPNKWEGGGLSLIVTGSWANVIDRGIFGRVTDYLALNFGSWHPFIFNIADVWISAGVCLFILAQLLTPAVPTGGAHRPPTMDSPPARGPVNAAIMERDRMLRAQTLE